MLLPSRAAGDEAKSSRETSLDRELLLNITVVAVCLCLVFITRSQIFLHIS